MRLNEFSTTALSRRSVFADTAHWIALFSPVDGLHSRAIEISQELDKARRKIWTTEAVLIEFLNNLSKSDATIRRRAVRFVQSMPQSNIVVMMFSEGDFEDALILYEKYADKHWSLTDCLSINAMKVAGIVDVLTSDHHFRQAGFNVLL